jgi:amino-acid N-acetyltransferase
MRIKKAGKEDLPYIKKLLKENCLPHEDISLDTSHFFIVETKNEFVGIGGVEIYGNFGLLRSILIMDSFRGKGYGKALCNRLIEYARNRGVEEIYLLTLTARDFFKKLGFEEINRCEVPSEIQETAEFRDLCPSTAVCMRIKLR